jgi:hypothetical protein
MNQTQIVPIKNNHLPVKRFIINLDQPNHWNALIFMYKKEVKDVYRQMIAMIGNSWMIKSASWLAKTILKGYCWTGNTMYLNELKEISEIVEISVEELILAQLCYEMFAACTSIVVQFDNKNFHYRTMDWDFDFLKKVTVELDFRRRDETIFVATSWVGYVGILTGMIPEKYSIALNYRRSDGNIITNVTRALKMCWPTGYLIRHILEEGMNFDQAKHMLERASLISPCYFTLCASVGKSYIFVRDPDRCIKTVASKNLLIQTNIDPDSSRNDENILYSIQRREKARSIVTVERENWNNHGDIYDSFNIWPIINDETVYVSIMNPSDGVLMTMMPE